MWLDSLADTLNILKRESFGDDKLDEHCDERSILCLLFLLLVLISLLVVLVGRQEALVHW